MSRTYGIPVKRYIGDNVFALSLPLCRTKASARERAKWLKEKKGIKYTRIYKEGSEYAVYGAK